MIDKDKLRYAICGKYGTIREFAKISNWEESSISRFLADKDRKIQPRIRTRLEQYGLIDAIKIKEMMEVKDQYSETIDKLDDKEFLSWFVSNIVNDKSVMLSISCINRYNSILNKLR